MIEGIKNEQDKLNKKREEKILALIKNGMSIPQADLPKILAVAAKFRHNRLEGISVNILGENEDMVKIKIPFKNPDEYTRFLKDVYYPDE